MIMIKLLDELATPPTRATHLSAGFDLMSMETVNLRPGERVKVGSGIALDLTRTTLAPIIIPRSGLGSTGLVLSNLVGLIDTDYQGEIKLTLWNAREDYAIRVERGQRVAQMLFINPIIPNFEVTEKFEHPTVRGDQGFGHSDKE